MKKYIFLFAVVLSAFPSMSQRLRIQPGLIISSLPHQLTFSDGYQMEYFEETAVKPSFVLSYEVPVNSRFFLYPGLSLVSRGGVDHFVKFDSVGEPVGVRRIEEEYNYWNFRVVGEYRLIKEKVITPFLAGGVGCDILVNRTNNLQLSYSTNTAIPVAILGAGVNIDINRTSLGLKADKHIDLATLATTLNNGIDGNIRSRLLNLSLYLTFPLVSVDALGGVE